MWNKFYKSFSNFFLGKSPTGEDFGGRFELSSIYPKPGFQNAPRFCSNQDKAVATFAFNVPKDLEPGKYTFMWLWAFNSMKDLYSSCFEVQIAANKVARNKALLVRTSFKVFSTTSNIPIRYNQHYAANNTTAVMAKYSILELLVRPSYIYFTSFFLVRCLIGVYNCSGHVRQVTG